MAKKPEAERLQKYLANLGLGARRKIDGLIEAGRVRVNGRVAVAGERVIPNSRITIDGKPVRQPAPGLVARRRVLLYHKPEGEVCSHTDARGRPSVFANLPRLKRQRWVAVGRLDLNTSGLLLFTNDGALAHRLMHPAFGIEREYLCRVYGTVSRGALRRLREGVEIDGVVMRFDVLRQRRGEGKNTWFSVTLREGRYREVRRLWQAVACQVSRLKRIRYGTVSIPRDLKPGRFCELSAKEIARLEDRGQKSEVRY